MSNKNYNLLQLSNESSFGFGKIIYSVILAYILTILIFMIFAGLITYSDFSENQIPSVVTGTTIIGVLIAGILSGRNSQSKGWFSGAIAGVIYVIILIILGAIILKNASFSRQVINIIIMGLVVGSIGGIIGINIGRRKIKRK
jgi:putative membrane protein (TIGR04086 family)